MQVVLEFGKFSTLDQRVLNEYKVRHLDKLKL